jgi:hypothetical protein
MNAPPNALHLLAHQAQLRARTASDWWDNPLDTALAAVSASRHPPAFRGDGELAVRRLRRWQDDCEPRRVSADATAIVLTAAAAASLGLRTHILDTAAIVAAEQLASRSRDAAPLLHIALTVWGLDSVVPDREQSPWPALRAHLDQTPSAHGRDEALLALSAALNATVLDGAGLVQTLLARVPGSPSLEDGAILLWILTVAIERAALSLPATDTGLRALSDRRAEMAERLAQELDAAAFVAPEIDDFDPDGTAAAAMEIYLSPLEALLLDISLASGEREQPWLRFEEAQELFGRREREVRQSLGRRTATLISTAAVLAGALFASVLVANSVRWAVAVAAAVALASVGCSVSATVLVRSRNTPMAIALLTFGVTLLLTALLDVVNELIQPHPLADATGVIIGIIAPVIAAVMAAVIATRSS